MTFDFFLLFVNPFFSSFFIVPITTSCCMYHVNFFFFVLSYAGSFNSFNDPFNLEKWDQSRVSDEMKIPNLLLYLVFFFPSNFCILFFSLSYWPILSKGDVWSFPNLFPNLGRDCTFSFFIGKLY